MTLEWKVRSYRSENGRKIMSEDRRSLENKDFLQISQLVLHSIKKWQNESSATFFALGRLASAQEDKIRVLTHRKGPSGLAGGGISM